MSSRTHRLKTWPSYFEAVVNGDKTFEVRYNDRDFKVGDVVSLEEYDLQPNHEDYAKGYTGRGVKKLVTYVMHGGKFGLDTQWCVLGLGRLPDDQ